MPTAVLRNTIGIRSARRASFSDCSCSYLFSENSGEAVRLLSAHFSDKPVYQDLLIGFRHVRRCRPSSHGSRAHLDGA